MRLLLDECVPRRLKFELGEHDVRTVAEMGWAAKRNGELLRLLVGERFNGLLTVDRNIKFQQNIRAAGVAVVIVVVRKNRMKELRPMVPAILEALKRLQPGELVEVA